MFEEIAAQVQQPTSCVIYTDGNSPKDFEEMNDAIMPPDEDEVEFRWGIGIIPQQHGEGALEPVKYGFEGEGWN